MPCSQTAKTKQMQYYNKFNKDFLKNGPKECFLFFFFKERSVRVDRTVGWFPDWGFQGLRSPLSRVDLPPIKPTHFQVDTPGFES